MEKIKIYGNSYGVICLVGKYNNKEEFYDDIKDIYKNRC